MFRRVQQQEPILSSSIMTRRLITERPETDVAQAIHNLLHHGISGMPVIDGIGKYLGVFSEKCCLRVLQRVSHLLGSPEDREPVAGQFMQGDVIALTPEHDVYDAIRILLSQNISGAPVVARNKEFLGIFSEKTSMSVLINGAMYGLPTTTVGHFLNADRGRLIDEQTTLLEVARIFYETPYRRLAVMRGNRVVGQISRRDVLRSSRILQAILQHQLATIEAKPDDDELHDVIRGHSELPSTSVSAVMDQHAKTVNEETDLLSIAGIFLSTPYRRLPVLRGDKIVGQISRRDVLRAAMQMVEPEEVSASQVLYLSAIRSREESSVV
ncbi:MAG: CBS domain-containing protein [Planctomycetaceae bacterium]|nr:CBS domain-containing protein [Planctomycetaceae bacterium]MCA9042875.1 CBS domain-containing protein [Planctomycetaceae bacterium]